VSSESTTGYDVGREPGAQLLALKFTYGTSRKMTSAARLRRRRAEW
jgi:hypothetical protein